MDLSIIYTKTGRGARALVKKLPAHAGQILSVIDGQLSAEVIFSQLKKMDMDEFEEGITWLVEGGFIKMVLKNPFPSSIWAPISKNAIQVSEISIDEFQDAQQTTTKTSGFASDTANNDTITTQTPSSPAKRELDENSAAIIENLIQADNEARERAEAQLKAQNSLSDAETESRNKAEQEARERAEAEARAKAAEEARLKSEAEIKARHDEEAKARAKQEAKERAEAEARTKAAEEARLKAEAAAKARIEAEAKAQAEKAAKAKAEQEAKARAEQEARERAEAEAQAKAAEEARLKAEAEAAAKAAEEARIKAEQEAKARAEEEARIQAEKAAKAKAEQEARERAEAEAEAAAKAAEEARIKAEEEAKARAEQEAHERAEAEALAKARAEEARLKAEAEAEAKAQAEREAWEKAEAEAKAKAEAKAERKARQKAEAKAKAEAEARAKAEAEVEAKTLAVQNALAEAEAAKKALAQATHRSSVIENDLIDFEEVLLPNKPATPAWKTGLTRVFNACSHKLAQISEKYQRINFRKIQRRLMPYWTAGFNIVSALFRKGSVVAIALFVIAAIAALFVNLRPLITPIESIATANLHEPVKIESIHAFVLPTPHFSLNNVKVGPFSKTIDFQTVQIYFSPINLKEKLLNHTETPYLLKSIKIEGANFKQDDWGRPVEWLAHFGKTKELQLDEIQLKNISLRMTETDMMNVNGAMLFKNNLLDNATFTNQDKNLEIKAARNADNNNYQLAIKARSWRTPVSPNILFFDLDANGTLDNNTLTLSPITGQAYDGDLKANLAINLSSGNISGDYTLEKMNLTDLAMDLKLNSIIDGALSMHANVVVDMDKTSHQLHSPKVNGHFSIANGAIRKIDITEAMRSGNLGGTTHFTSLEGDASLSNQDYQFTNLLLRDNQLEANGNLQISAQNSVTAIVNSKILVKTNPIKARLNIIGNVNNLSLKK